jgi:predicted transcriptional regulator
MSEPFVTDRVDVTRQEVAEMLGVTVHAVSQWLFYHRQGVAAYEDFPQPRRDGFRNVWSRAEVIDWAQATGRRVVNPNA